MDQHNLAGVTERGRPQHLQALEDAIKYRTARAAAPCPDCWSDATGSRCVDHACDLSLITAYQRTATAVILAMNNSASSSLVTAK